MMQHCSRWDTGEHLVAWVAEPRPQALGRGQLNKVVEYQDGVMT